ncbi:MAG: sigma-54-dependent Fis family transcriptional regulator [Sandarakinorhabdus sp.]|nr:sigma-54-dependent Fis family transcriptional regulator [Sandarakinorhabdus sp.]
MAINRHSTQPQLASLVGNSKQIGDIRETVETVADSTASVLITGPSGSGKDVVAQLLHQRSCRAPRPFVALNCAAVAPDLLESEMFGHEAGAFTGAVRARPGRFEAADGGTLFLDEVGDMAPAMQAKLLRVLETRVVERVGSMLPIPVDVRLCAATSVDLFAAIDRGCFRSDLLYRLDVIRIEMPALADRIEDVPLLVQHFCRSQGHDGISFDRGAMALLMSQPWPGNVRELKNAVDRVHAHCRAGVVDREMLARLLQPPRPWVAHQGPAAPSPQRVGSQPLVVAAPMASLADGGVDLKRILHDLELAYITQALTASGGGVAATAKLLGLQRTTLIEKMRRMQIGTA